MAPTALQNLLQTYRDATDQQHQRRERGTYFEELIITYLRHEATYTDLYSDVWTFKTWANTQHDFNARDTGIDLVAQTHTGEYHAIQCKFYEPHHRVSKKDIDSFFTASGRQPFAHRLIITTTDHWTDNAQESLKNQQPPVSKIDLNDLENSQIDWAQYQPNQHPILKDKKTPRPHQQKAIKDVKAGLQTAERGKLIMACGSGKTYTSLKIAELLSGKDKRVLFLVPSLSLLSQTLTEWTQQSDIPLHSFAVCSDSDIGKQRRQDNDSIQTYTHELRYPATTDPQRLASEMQNRHDSHHMSVVFSTYHSIAVINQAQQQHGLADFDLIICDEAHRTTGATFENDTDSNFTRIHDGSYIHGNKRLYMTATPRIYGEDANKKAQDENITLYSMDNPDWYGEQLHVLTFSEAVERKLLVDYKVMVLAVQESHVSRRIQDLLKADDNQLKVDDAAKIIGCWKALSKQGAEQDLADDAQPMRRAVAFAQIIEPSYKGKKHKVSSKNIAKMFQPVIEAYQKHEERHGDIETSVFLQCEAEHIDGGMNASEKERQLQWLKAEPPADTCRILSNVRCLSEGVDVPALDAVLFLTPRNSQVDVVQSVGRVMRLAEGKTRGYIILPVVIPYGVEPHEALNDNETYRVVWEVLNALRSHDDRFDAMINKLDLVGHDSSKMEVIAVTDHIAGKSDNRDKKAKGKRTDHIGKAPQDGDDPQDQQLNLQFQVGEIERALYAKVVKKCGNRHHWEDWANDIAKIANSHIDRITGILENPDNTREQHAFNQFAQALRDDLNDSLSEADIIEMLAQHLVTKPVFDALFSGYNFTEHNPMSKAMQALLDILQEHRLDKETDTLDGFYASVQLRVQGIDSASAKQKIVVELYDKFFRNAFPRMTDRLGIVYTPTEVVDFIIHSIEDLLQSEFGQSLASENVHILDPFTGTGTFITRLLQSGIIPRENLPYKYEHEIHANEIVLLAYYIAAINIEAVYHDLSGRDYHPFNGICLTDTFQLNETGDLISALLKDNNQRRKKQKALDIRVIMGNPPYSAGQTSANDNNANVAYEQLDQRIADTYAARGKAVNKNALYDSYIRAIRWASDRIGNSGIIGFVTNAGFIEANTADGLRQCLTEEFSSLYLFHLRGNARTQGEQRRKEKDNIFGVGSRAPVAINLLVKNPRAKQHGEIHFHDIGDYLSREDKLQRISDYHSIAGISATHGWQTITPDAHGDWLNQRDNSFAAFIKMGDKKDKTAEVVFGNYSRGVMTSKDAWLYNFSKKVLASNASSMIDVYSHELERYINEQKKQPKGQKLDIKKFFNTDSTKISWDGELLVACEKGKRILYKKKTITKALYRPFSKQWYYFDTDINLRLYQMPRIFPDATAENLVICATGRGSNKEFCTLITDTLPDLEMVSKAQCFPLYLYDTEADTHNDKPQGGLFDTQAKPAKRREAITDAGLQHFAQAYPQHNISKPDLFYYIYGILHSPDYREQYAANLSKELPRIPRVKTAADFWAFSQAGRDLAELHLNYETVAMHPVTLDSTAEKPEHYRVVKMKYAKKKLDGKSVNDLSTVIYNPKITIKDIPEQAYEYIVNGKPALDWVIERQGIKTDKASGIVNDANDWATETMQNPKYPLELFLRIITVSLETIKIVKALPKLDILD